MFQHLSRLNYDLIGNLSSKENLVFVHGTGCNRRFLRPLAEKLSDYNCYLIDLPDHGKSPNLNCTKVEDYIEAVSEFVSELPNVTLIGHSLGATICLGVAARSIPSIQRTVIISGGAKFDKLDKRVEKMVRTQKVDWLFLLRSLGSLHHISVIKALFTFDPTDVILKDFAIDLEVDLEHEVPKIKIPTLLMVGTRDILVLPEYSHRLKQKIRKSKLVLVPYSTHMLPISRKREVAYMIRTFIRKK